MPDPVILELGSLQLRWYGVFAATAMLVSYFMLTLRARKSTFLKQDDVPSLLALCIVAGLIGARAEYVRRFWTEFFSHDPAAIFRVWQGGLVFQGGFILGFLAALVYCRVRKWPCGALGDLVAPVLAVGHGVARLGCLFNGCCFGRPWSHFGGVQYPDGCNDVFNTQLILGQLPDGATCSLPVIPTQLIEALCCFAIAGIIFLCERRRILEGRRFFVYLLGYCAARFFLEFLRGDYHAKNVLTPAQWTTVLVIVPATLAVFVWDAVRRKNNRTAGKGR